MREVSSVLRTLGWSTRQRSSHERSWPSAPCPALGRAVCIQPLGRIAAQPNCTWPCTLIGAIVPAMVWESCNICVCIHLVLILSLSLCNSRPVRARLLRRALICHDVAHIADSMEHSLFVRCRCGAMCLKTSVATSCPLWLKGFIVGHKPLRNVAGMPAACACIALFGRSTRLFFTCVSTPPAIPTIAFVVTLSPGPMCSEMSPGLCRCILVRGRTHLVVRMWRGIRGCGGICTTRFQ